MVAVGNQNRRVSAKSPTLDQLSVRYRGMSLDLPSRADRDAISSIPPHRNQILAGDP